MKSELFSKKIQTLNFDNFRSGGAGIPFPRTPFPSRPALASTSVRFAGVASLKKLEISKT
jgi:hypothetical protein